MLKAIYRKHKWRQAYRHLPKEDQQRVIQETKDFVRVGPIELPLKMDAYPLNDEMVVKKFTLQYFQFFKSGGEYYILTPKEDFKFENPLVRLSSNCNWAFDFNSLRCDCRWQFEDAKKIIAEEPRQDGLLIFAHDQHGKSIPGKTLGHSIIYALGQAKKQDLVKAAYLENGFELDYRKYDDIALILKSLGVTKIRLMTNNPDRIQEFQNFGFEVTRVAIEKDYQLYDAEELGVKKTELGHLLNISKFKKTDVKIYGLDHQKVFGKEA